MHRRGGGSNISVGGSGTFDDVEMFVSKANFLVSEANILVSKASKLCAGTKNFGGPQDPEILGDIV